MISALDRLRLFLRPPGKGILTLSTGGGYAKRLHEIEFSTSDPKTVQSFWEDGLQRIRRIDTILFGIPSDTGAGIRKGANFGPIGVREAYFTKYGAFPKNILDLGDVVCIPHFLHDDMLAESQKKLTREALYPGVSEPLPVSPLSIAESVYEAIRELNPNAKVFMLGGDHSVSWPAMLHNHALFGKNFGLLHFDAHTDLLQSRFGVKICFGTWARHAVPLMEPHSVLQVGIRTSEHTKEEWMRDVPLVQLWAHEIVGREEEAREFVLNYFESRNISRIYLSNDIDGTDARWGHATGTPEINGPTKKWVKSVIEGVVAKYGIVGGDIVEVAPPLSGEEDYTTEVTCRTAADYLRAMLGL